MFAAISKFFFAPIGNQASTQTDHSFTMNLQNKGTLALSQLKNQLSEITISDLNIEDVAIAARLKGMGIIKGKTYQLVDQKSSHHFCLQAGNRVVAVNKAIADHILCKLS